jgi:hypothetical protein
MKRAALGMALGATVALATARAHAETATFALVVTNNRSAATHRPDLRYADDDGARYYRLFEALENPHHTLLLTTLDRPTARLFPDLVPLARRPRTAEVKAAIAEIRRRVAAAHRAGHRTEFYFVFAGHGDVDGGRGYLELEDGRIDAEFLEHEIVERVDADVEHLVLDSCNSFFVLNPRKPGGRRWATPSDISAGFARRHPKVGLLLSTNAEAEVYEWSELEAGIFSHEVRSGLVGAADVNSDGVVSYAELAGFVETANVRIPREQYRPHVYFRGPAGNNDAALFPFARLGGRKLVLGRAQQRLWMRGPSGERLLDLHKEAGAMRITLPGHDNDQLSVYEWKPAKGPEGRPDLREYSVGPSADPVRLAALESKPPEEAARGAPDVFGSLFADPFGPRAYQKFLSALGTTPEPVYGVSRKDEERARHYLDAIAETGKSRRMTAGFVGVSIAAGFGGAGLGLYLARPSAENNRVGGAIFGGIAALAVGGSLYSFLSTTEEEDLRTEFDASLRSGNASGESIVAETDLKLERLAAKIRTQRTVAGWVGGFVGAGMMAIGIYNLAEAHSEPTQDKRTAAYTTGALLTGLGLGYGVMLAFVAGQDTPTEKLIRLYRQDPGLKVGIQAAPIGASGFGLAVSGRF